jgi:hypothetical protein
MYFTKLLVIKLGNGKAKDVPTMNQAPGQEDMLDNRAIELCILKLGTGGR